MFIYDHVTLVRVIDGDTVVVDIDLGMRMWAKGVPVRLAGINTPERGQPGYADATAKLRELTAGKSIALHSHEWDKYGRIVGTLFADGVHVNQAMLASKMAALYPVK